MVSKYAAHELPAYSDLPTATSLTDHSLPLGDSRRGLRILLNTPLQAVIRNWPELTPTMKPTAVITIPNSSNSEGRIKRNQGQEVLWRSTSDVPIREILV